MIGREQTQSVVLIALIIIFIIALIIAIPWDFVLWVGIDNWRMLSEIFRNLVTAIGIILGGYWTYHLFVKERSDLPKCKIDFIVEKVLLPENTNLIHVEVIVTNIGKVMLVSDSADLRLSKIIPIPDELRPMLKEGLDPVPDDNEYDWPVFTMREWNTRCFEIEPGEKDSLHADFMIPNDIEVVQFYCHIDNPEKNDMGWTSTHIHRFDIKETDNMLDEKRLREPVNEEQKPKRPKPAQTEQRGEKLEKQKPRKPKPVKPQQPKPESNNT